LKEITIKTVSPIAADRLLVNFGILMEGGGKGSESVYVKDEEGNYRARSIGDLEYAKFAIKNQGYGIEIIEQSP
jgi:hypothetical protein